ncbi:MAG: FMN-binding protein [Pirellulales bacterium]|nr:FMN-binding protein [Pirellulales bacterium]
MRRLVWLMVFILLSVSSRLAADVVELTSGSKLTGRVTARDANAVTIEVTFGDRTYSRICPIERIHAVTIDGKREILRATETDSSPSGASTAPQPAGKPGGGPTSGPTRTPAQVEALIEEQGRTAPDWWDSVALEYPRTLDLNWPVPPPRGWDNQRNVGQYVWDVVNPNPRKWRSGVRLMHHLLAVHENHPATQRRVMNELGRMYGGLLEDYARAAFWWRKAEVDRGDAYLGNGVRLAECYWRLGNKQMALDLMSRQRPQFAMIKLWGDMGETDLALRLADANLRGAYGDLAGIYAGDACRVGGRNELALKYYQRVLAVRVPSQQAKARVERNQQRARANIEAIRLFQMLDLSRVPDGAYRGNSPGYAGQVFIEVTVRGGRIESVEVTDHQEKQFYSAINDTTRKIVRTQGVQGIDATTGATMTSEAIINAVAKALGAAME